MTSYVEDVRTALAEVAPHLASEIIPMPDGTLGYPDFGIEAESRIIYRAAMLVWRRRGWVPCCFECWDDQAPLTSEHLLDLRANGCPHEERAQ